MKLKAVILSVMMALMAVNFSSCSSRRTTAVTSTSTKKSYSSNTAKKKKAKRLPPGQAKKVYGDKSARKYAPGHNKG